MDNKRAMMEITTSNSSRVNPRPPALRPIRLVVLLPMILPLSIFIWIEFYPHKHIYYTMPCRNVNTKAILLSGFLQGIYISFTNRRQGLVAGKTEDTQDPG
jgi:hypothetical protein